MLFIPLAVAAGMTQIDEKGEFDLKQLRANMKLAVESTTAQDAVNLYDAIAIASPSGLNDAPDLDVNDANSKTRLIEEDVSLYQVFKIGAGYDDICYEWVNNFPIAFELAYPYLMEQLYAKKKCLNTAITHTFLKVLSERPDTFISRKVGLEKTLDVSKDAKNVLELGGLDTPKGRESILLFDRKLRECGNNYNPGTTADITAATLALGTLSGYRP
jgi:triphosphoribosyl-dephospho-CoA synthase